MCKLRPCLRPLLLLVTLVTLAACGDDGDSGGDVTDTTQIRAAGICVDGINQHRASIGLSPYARWTDAERCSAEEAASDAAANQAHGAFGKCGENAQNECPGWGGPPEQMITDCLQMMWDEGPGDDFQAHGHYLTMSSTGYTRVACGFHTLPDGQVWAVQNFQ